MGKRFIISESEKNEIRKMYGLVVEVEQNLPSLPYIVSKSWTAPDCDALHAFQSRKENTTDKNGVTTQTSVVYGDMSAKVTEALSLFWNKIPVKVTSIKITVNGMNVSYEVIIDKSPNGIGMNGMTTRGAGCGNNLKSPSETEEFLKKRATTEQGKSPSEIQSSIKSLPNVGNLNYFEEISSFYDPNLPDGKKMYQVFYQYQTDSPPSVKSQETINKENQKPTQQQTPSQQQTQTTPNTKTNRQDNIAEFDKLAQRIKTETENASIDVDSVALDLTDRTFSFSPGDRKIKKLILVIGRDADGLSMNQNLEQKISNIKNKNPEYTFTPINAPNFCSNCMVMNGKPTPIRVQLLMMEEKNN